MLIHRFATNCGHDNRCAGLALGADGTEQIGRLKAAIPWCPWPCATSPPDPVSAYLADQHGLRRRTRSPPACPPPLAAMPRLREPETPPERRLCLGIALGMLRAHRKPSERQLVQQLANRAFVQADAKALLDSLLKVDSASAPHRRASDQHPRPPRPRSRPAARPTGVAAGRCAAVGPTGHPARWH